MKYDDDHRYLSKIFLGRYNKWFKVDNYITTIHTSKLKGFFDCNIKNVSLDEKKKYKVLFN